MKFANMPLSVVAVVLTLMVGCTAPPSVTPLLRVAARAMREEAARVEEDAKRDQAQIEQSRQTLATAFEDDLDQRTSFDRPWIKDAAEAYAAAREELARHAAALRDERAQRTENLRAAAQAQERAIALLERQDELITRTTGLDIWRMKFSAPLQPLNTKEKP